MLDWFLQVHLATHQITASECISKYGRPQPPSTSAIALDHSLSVYH
jgi:hypothetical protein